MDVISTIKNKYPRFLFIAEAYRDLEWELQQQGFDFCYDKTERDKDEMLSPGLYVELGPWNYHFFQCVRTNQT